MSLGRLNFLNWSIRTKLVAIFIAAVLVPMLLILVPISTQRREQFIRDQNTARLEMMGPYEVTRTSQALGLLRDELVRLVSPVATYNQLEDYFFKMTTMLPDTERELLERTIEGRSRLLMQNAPSITRIRYYGEDTNLIVDANNRTGSIVLRYELTARERTAADDLITADTVLGATTLTGIYRDAAGTPSIDVVFPFLYGVRVSGVPRVIGYMVFTQDLTKAADDPLLPDVFGTLLDFPQGDLPTHVFLLDEAGRLVSPASGSDFLADASATTSFQAAQQGESRVQTYRSALLGEDVLGYATLLTVPDGPQLTVQAEVPMAEIQGAALESGLFELAVLIGTVSLLVLLATWIGNTLIAAPVVRLTAAARQVSSGSLDVELAQSTRRDEIGVLTNTFAGMAGQLLQSIEELESRVAARTRDLETSLEIGRVLTSIRDRDTLLDEVVNLIRDQFDTIYHAQIFLVDQRSGQAQLRASTGDVGRELLARGHALAVGSQSVIGSVTASGHAVVALDTSANPVHRRNEFLPDTRAEMALPLRLGTRIVGALDLQSTQPNAFSEQDVELFQGMSDQITIAIQNAILFDESSARLREIERLNRTLTRVAWQELERSQGEGVLSAAAGQATAGNGWSALQRQAMRTRDIAEQFEGDTVTFAVPLVLRGEVLGAVEWQVPVARYTSHARQTAQELTDRLALAADNIRLFDQSRQAAQRELFVNQISGKLTGTTDIDQILQTAVRELGLALHLPQTAIHLAVPGEPGPAPVLTDDMSE